MNFIINRIFFVFFLLIPLKLNASDNLIEIQSNISFYKISNNTSTWWQNNNNHGFDIEGSFISSSMNISKKNVFFQNDFFYSTHNKSFYSKYLNFNYQHSEKLNFMIGRFSRQFSNYLDDSLSSGSMLVSTNAQPIPRLGVYYNNSLKKRPNISFKAGIAHGKFDSNKYYKDAPYLHEKFFYLINKKTNFEYGVGLVHEAMWSGHTILGKHTGKQPNSFKDFLKVFISADGPLREGEPHANALGNHLGIWDFYSIYHLSKFHLKFYYQHFFEDTSSFRFANKTDGLWGIQFDSLNKNSGLLFEFLNTTNCCIDPPYQADNYYWNYQYRSGWRYKDNIVGNAFVNPINNDNNVKEKIKLAHVGAYFNTKNMKLHLLTSRKIHLSDSLKTKFNITTKFNDNVYIDLLIFNKNKFTNYGLGLIYNF